MGDWQPKRDDNAGTGRGASEATWKKYVDSLKGKHLFTFILSVGVFNPDFSDVEPASNVGRLLLSSLGTRKGNEIENYSAGWVKGSVETMVSLIQKEKAPRPITMVWEDDGRHLFTSTFKGKKLNYEIWISVGTPEKADVQIFTLTLNDCHITGVGQEFHKIDNKNTKFTRINSTCSGTVELKPASQ